MRTLQDELSEKVLGEKPVVKKRELLPSNIKARWLQFHELVPDGQAQAYS